MLKTDAIAGLSTMYPNKVADTPNILLRPASNNRKLGKQTSSKVWMKGGKEFRGKPLFLLTLEERATCPATCQALATCYGNNMPFAVRSNHMSPSFLPRLEAELSTLSAKHPTGITVRLHVLGDFYSTEYVNFWAAMLEKFPKLAIFGYTHRTPDSIIGREVAKLVSGRFSILFSDIPPQEGLTVAARLDAEGEKYGLPVCPHQEGKVKSCLDCGLCTNAPGFRGIGFRLH